MGIPREELDASTASHNGLHCPVATGDESVPPEEMRGEAVAPPSPRGGRLQDDRWIRDRDKWHDRLAPASVMRKLHQVAAKIDQAIARPRREQRSGLRLDVARQEDGRTAASLVGRTLDADDEREVVVAP